VPPPSASRETDPPTLVLLTPIGLDAGCWQWLELPAGLEVARPEHPGHGSRPRASAQFDLDQIADEVAAAHPGPLHLVGVSLGGMIAQHLALRHPRRVSSLLLACTGPSGDAARMRARAAETEEKGMEGVLEATLERWFTPEALSREPEHPGVAYARRTLLALDPGSFADGWRAIGTHDVLDRLGEIDAPTTCLAGSADPAAPPERMRSLAEAVPGARLSAVEGGPHMLHLERPDEFSAALRRHLEEAGAL
jgi:3-oxoadipate enol-lactonase